jgi:hypothetical protein
MSATKRELHFSFLTDKELIELENAVWKGYNRDTQTAQKGGQDESL